MRFRTLRDPTLVAIVLIAVTVDLPAVARGLSRAVTGRTPSSSGSQTSAAGLTPLLFLSGPASDRTLIVSDGTSTPRLLRHDGVRPDQATWLAGGTRVLVETTDGHDGRQAWTVDVATNSWQPVSGVVGDSFGAGSRGRALAVIDRDGGVDVVRIDGTRRRRVLAPGPLAPATVTWRPNGPATLGVVGHEAGSQSDDVFTVRTDGTDLRVVLDHNALPPGRCASGVDLFENLQWSPDGQRLAADMVTISGGCVEQRVVVATVGGTAPIAPTVVAEEAYGPRWAPNGAQLAFTSLHDGNPPEVVRARVDGTGSQVVSDGRDPSWSENGNYLALVTPQGTVWVVSASDGKTVADVPSPEGPAALPEFSPTNTPV